jgi:FkbM family methyltransferase
LIKKILVKFKLYNFLRHSFLYYLILRIKNPEYVRSLDEDYIFFKKILIKKDIIFDIGSNQGDKAYVFSKLARKVVLFEPNKEDYQFLNYRFKNNNKVIIENLAIAKKRENKRYFLVFKNNNAYNTLNYKRQKFLENKFTTLVKKSYVKTETINFYIQKYGIPNFVKIDVEGLELEILKSLKTKYKRDISIICFEANIPLFLKETLMIINLFYKNFFNLRIWDKYKFVYDNNITATELKSYLKNVQDKTFDIFIFNTGKN